MISHKFKFVFVHIPRTGGTSFTEYIRKYCTKRSNLGKDNDEFIEVSHTPIWKLKQAYFKDRDDWDDYFKFAIVRNPYDRMVSIYRALTTWDSFHGMMKELSDDTKWNEYNRLRYGTAMLWPAKIYLCEFGNPSMLDGFIKFENMLEEIPMMLSTLGIKVLDSDIYPHANKTEERGPYREYYDDYCKEVVQKRYGWDLKEFGYGF